MIDKRYMKYIPKKILPYLTWLNREEGNHSHYYFIAFEKDGNEYEAEPAKNVSEIVWHCKRLYKEMGLCK